ncbi:2-hydroxychromene-2-carboxylate isomerase [Paraburkholderia caribensis MBA4]|uniref:2-hydroxychromene-2-carboxylate isomerase n=1 Tax=Paraburkholderia caribensis MBA4 TaxID=1323664 RepID=A0A0P0RIE7_9BURK|nr:2-hydroxychromene-2-carboxylate isomerase [Paraburkholderia caribensis]ALL68344.1 2-hydroxychromene-2-carboxylate isomerase [Paraburkholderia caribensis MBA4]
MKRIDYYFWINSDWAYLGADRLEAIARKHDAELNYMPVDLPHVYSRTGGILLSKRAPERQRYRITELRRFCEKLEIHVNPEPKHMCPNGDLASRVVIAAKRRNLPLLELTKAIFKAEWADEKDISDPETLLSIVNEAGFDGKTLFSESENRPIQEEYWCYTQHAIAAGAFGSPSYVYRGELFWGQDRLAFLDEALSR